MGVAAITTGIKQLFSEDIACVYICIHVCQRINFSSVASWIPMLIVLYRISVNAVRLIWCKLCGSYPGCRGLDWIFTPDRLRQIYQLLYFRISDSPSILLSVLPYAFAGSRIVEAFWSDLRVEGRSMVQFHIRLVLRTSCILDLPFPFLLFRFSIMDVSMNPPDVRSG